MTFYPGSLDEFGTNYTDVPPVRLHRWFVRAFNKQYFHGPWGWILEQHFILPTATCWLFDLELLRPAKFFATTATPFYGIAHLLDGFIRWSDDHHPLTLGPNQSASLYLPLDRRQRVEWTAGKHQLWMVQWHPAFLSERGLFPALLEPTIQQLPLMQGFIQNYSYPWATVLPALYHDPHPSLLLETRLLDALRVYHPIQETATDLQDGKVRNAWHYIGDHLHEELTISNLARKVVLNDSALKAGFKQLYGTTVHAHIYELRMQRAILLLQTTDRLIHDIANTCGYAYPSHFSKMFQRRFGKKPGEVRRK